MQAIIYFILGFIIHCIAYNYQELSQITLYFTYNPYIYTSYLNINPNWFDKISSIAFCFYFISIWYLSKELRKITKEKKYIVLEAFSLFVFITAICNVCDEFIFNPLIVNILEYIGALVGILLTVRTINKQIDINNKNNGKS